MRRITRIMFIVLAAMLVAALSVPAVFAEPDVTSQEVSSSDVTSQEESSVPSEPEFTVKLSASPSGSVLCYFNGSSEPQEKYTGKSDESVSVHIVSQTGYELTGVKLNGFRQTVASGECSFSFDASVGESYEIKTTATAATPPSEKFSLSVAASGISGITVNGSAYSSSLEFESGTEITVAFGSGEGFDASLARLTVNGTAVTMTGNTYSFAISKNTEISLKYNLASVTFNISGLGSVTVGDTVIQSSSTDTSTVRSFELSLGQTVSFSMTPASSYKLGSFGISGASITQQDGVYTVSSLTGDATVNIQFSYSGGGIVEKYYNIVVSAGANGTVTVDDVTFTGTRTFTRKAGLSASFTVTPDTGYELDAFKVGGAAQTLSGGKYTITDIGSDYTIAITFKEIATPPIVTDQPIGVSDIDWTASVITVDITTQTKIKPEVFTKIASLTSSGTTESYVMFRGTTCTWYIPYGGKVSGGSTEYGDLAISNVASGSDYDKIKSVIASSTEADIKFKVFAVTNGLSFPSGTKLAFNMGSEYSGSYVMMLVYDSTNNKLADKASAADAILVGTNGWSGSYAYDNESLLVCTQDIDGQYTVNAGAGAGGLINPSGSNIVTSGSDSSYTVTASEGFVIKQLLVDGLAVSDAAGKSEYTYTFNKVETDHTIAAEFVLAGDFSNTESGGTNTTLIVTLIIIFVAVAGAAALFIVKWRQEKF